MSEPRKPTHLRRAKLAKRAQLVLAIAAGAFAIYRIAAQFLHPGVMPH